MRSLKAALTAAAAACIAAAGTAAAADDIKVYVNGEQIGFDVPPIIENERTLVPMRAIFEALGAEVSWDGETATVTAKKGDDTESITIGSNILYINGKGVELDVPAKIVDERTLVPVRAVAESFNANVEWDGETQSVLITEQPTEQPFDTLTEADMAVFKEKAQFVRYTFEQMSFPKYVLDGNIKYEDLELSSDGKNGKFFATVCEQWEKNAASFIIELELNSDTVYVFGASGKNDGSNYVAEGCHKILKAAGMDGEATFRATGSVESKAGTRLAIIEFEKADTLTDCKYLAIAASKDGKVRYFTAENDIMREDTWYFCEVTKDYRGTISAFDKTDTDTDLNIFASYCFKAFEEDIYASSKLERSLD